MNTRLQVEHPVTELVTGLDLVEWQLRVAAGEPLPLSQEQITFTGHAIEARLVAEDPYDGWKPQTGRIQHWQPAQAGVRVDHGIAEGDEITPWYDAMVAKVIAHGSSREDAVRRLTRALQDAPLLGVVNNGRFLADLLNDPQFTAAELTTTRLDEWAAQGEPCLQRPAPSDLAWQLAAALRGGAPAARPASVDGFELTLQCQGQTRTQRVPAEGLTLLETDSGRLRFSQGRLQRHARFADDGIALHLALDGAVHTFTEPSAWPTQERTADPRQGRAPVAGVVAQVRVAVGDRLTAGQPLVCIEAMKMEMWLTTAAAGTVRAVHARLKDSVASGAVLVELELAQ
jgi:geranyl-CoA carboxylase alpha subunit